MSRDRWRARVLGALFIRDELECHYCGRQLSTGDWMADDWPQIEHKVAWWWGGDDSLDNLVLACKSCNSSKGTRSHDEFCRRCLEETERRAQATARGALKRGASEDSAWVIHEDVHWEASQDIEWEMHR